MKYLVTGAAGFIGMHTAKALIDQGHSVVGIDNLNDYYDVSLKHSRLDVLKSMSGFLFEECSLEEVDKIDMLFKEHRFDRVIHLAAQAGVRYSLESPFSYVESNITGTLSILEACRHNGIEHLIYASSSSVYGLNSEMPFSVSDQVNHPASLYAATKRSNELMAHTYSHLYGIPTTGLRFFTVYGPWGRPDMAPFLFADALIKGDTIKVFNYGKMKRDFTYIDDIVDGIVKSANIIPNVKDKEYLFKGAEFSTAPYRVFNIGNSTPVELEYFIQCMEKAFDRKAKLNYLPMQPGDVHATYADVSPLSEATGFTPKINIETGTKMFADWFSEYYGVNK